MSARERDSASPHRSDGQAPLRQRTPTQSNSTINGSGSGSAVVQACDFCRRRKIRCDGRSPCVNCERRGITCETVARDQVANRPRPSRALIQGLQEDLDELRDFVENLKHCTEPERSELLSAWKRNGPTPTPSRAVSLVHPDTSISQARRDVSPSDLHVTQQMHVAIDGQTSYHGHTSVFHSLQDGHRGGPSVQRARPSFTTPEDRATAESLLTDAAARYRNLEIMDLAAGRLDFDGIAPEVAMELLSIHWHRQHHALLLTYRPPFMRDMAVPGGGKYFSKLLLNVIYFGAAKYSQRPELRADPDDPRTAGFNFLKRINELMGEAISRSRIPTVQALLLLASSLFALGQHESAWLYSGLAFRMIIDLGLHIDNSAFDKTLTPEDVEIRRRVLYGSFCFDKIHSLYQGRPPTLQETDIRVPLVFNDTYEETELWRPTSYHTGSSTLFRSGVPAYSVTTFTAMCKLCFILGRVLNSLYSFSSFALPPTRHLENLRILEADLQQFEQDLPEHLRIGSIEEMRPRPSNVLALHSVWQTMVILLYRPFVELGHLRDPGGQVTERSWQKCIKAADTMSDVLRIHSETLGFRRAPFLISYCAYIAATIHVRMVAQKGSHSSAMRRLQFCMEIFQETETINTGVSRAKQVLLSLMDRLGVTYTTTNGANTKSPQSTIQEAASVGSYQDSTELQAAQVDMDALFRSFATLPDTQNSTQNTGSFEWTNDIWPGALFGDPSNTNDQDVLYGLMSGGNNAGYDGLFRSHNL